MRALVMETASTTPAFATDCGRHLTARRLAARITARVTAIAATEPACAVGDTQGLIAPCLRVRMSAQVMEHARMVAANAHSLGPILIAQ